MSMFGVSSSSTIVVNSAARVPASADAYFSQKRLQAARCHVVLIRAEGKTARPRGVTMRV